MNFAFGGWDIGNQTSDIRLMMNVHKCASHFASGTGSNLRNENLMIKKVHKPFKN